MIDLENGSKERCLMHYRLEPASEYFLGALEYVQKMY